MMFTIRDISDAVNGEIIGLESGSVEAVSTDSRTVKPGDLFIALTGGKFDGHDYLEGLTLKGVKVAIAEKSRLKVALAGMTVIAVEDTLVALGDLAAAYRRRFELPLVGITGSNGKTTTKEMLASILETTGPGLKTAGNLNNLIGLPQMLFQLEPEHEWAILEMGMSEPGEIDRLAEIAAPMSGVITNAYPAHLASMGSVAGVAKAKGELFKRLSPGGIAIYNADDPLISACPVAEGVKRLGFGLHGADVTATDIKGCGKEGQSFVLNLCGQKSPVMLRAFGSHNIYNALAAAAAAYALAVPLEKIVAGLEAFSPFDKRFRLEDLGSVVLIDDSYNSNPASVGAALLTVRELKGERRAIAAMGDMLELGTESESSHRDVGRLAATCIDRLYLFGEMAMVTAEAAVEGGMAPEEVIVVASHNEIVNDMVKDHIDGDYILVKGSRGMRMDLVSSALREIFSGYTYKSGGRG